MAGRRVVVTGLGALTPIGNNLGEYWEGLTSGRSGAAPITRFDASKFKTRFACELKGFDALQFLDRKEARKLDPFVQYAMVCATEAVEDAGLAELGAVDPDRAGVIWASGIGGLDTLIQEISEFALGDGSAGQEAVVGFCIDAVLCFKRKALQSFVKIQIIEISLPDVEVSNRQLPFVF